MCKKLVYCSCSFVVLLSLILSSAASAGIPGLIGWYKLDDGTGTIATDSSGLGNHGSLGPEGNPQWVAGIKGGAIDLDGSDDYVEINAIADHITNNNFSVFAWINTTMTGDGNVIASNTTGSSHDFIFGVIDGALLVEADSLNRYSSGLTDGRWHHIGYVRDGTTAYLYVDGIQVGTETPSGDPSGQARWSIGQEWDSSPSDEYTGLVDDVQFYNRPLSAAEVVLVMIGTPPGVATKPNPENEETDVFRDTDLSWTPGEFAAAVNGHRVYLGESFNDVNTATGGVSQSAAVYDPGRLNTGTTYYWRVDEVNAPPTSTVYKGEVWSFTTEPLAYPVDGANIIATASSKGQDNLGPENTVNGSGLDDNDGHSVEPTDMWLSGNEPSGAWIQYEFDKTYKLHEMLVWNSNQVFEPLFGFGMKGVTVEYSTNGADWTALADVPEFAKATGMAAYAPNTTVAFGGAAAKFVKLTATSNWGGVLPQYGLSEVRFLYVPVSARKPSPESGATDVAVDGTLSWRPGREAAKHSVYVSTDQQAVIDGTAPAVSVTDASYPSNLTLASNYYWRVDEVNDIETPTTWQSDVWEFATQEYIVVEDFEDYNDYPPHEIYTTWEDGYLVPANGSQVGNLSPPLVETTIVHGGMQSMPFFYSNTAGATYSEGKRTFAAPQNWAGHGIRTLSIYFFGTAGNTGQLYVKINNSKIPYGGAASNVASAGWQPWHIDLTAAGLSLQNVSSLAIGVDGNGAAGTLYFDDICLYPYASESITPTAPNNAGLIAHWKFDGNLQDASGKGNHGTGGGSPTFVPGQSGQAVNLNGSSYVVIDGIVDDLTTTRFTMCAWIKTTQTDDGNVVASNDTAGSNHDFIIGVDQGLVLVEADSIRRYPPAVNDNQWHFIVYARDGDIAYVYVDGFLVGTETPTGNVLGQGRWSIGQEWDSADSTSPSDFYTGAVDEVRVYNYTLSHPEAAWLAGRTEPFPKPF